MTSVATEDSLMPGLRGLYRSAALPGAGRGSRPCGRRVRSRNSRIGCGGTSDRAETNVHQGRLASGRRRIGFAGRHVAGVVGVDSITVARRRAGRNTVPVIAVASITTQPDPSVAGASPQRQDLVGHRPPRRQCRGGVVTASLDQYAGFASRLRYRYPRHRGCTKSMTHPKY